MTQDHQWEWKRESWSGGDPQQPHDAHCASAHKVQKEEKGEPLKQAKDNNKKG